MCGINCIINFKNDCNNKVFFSICQKINEELVHRGPDDSDIWIDEDNLIGLTHRRLSILDLSSSGRQPMHSSSNRYVISYNGEIYNHNEIRKKIIKSNNYNFKSGTDTETLLESIELFGIENTLKNLNGMFSFVIWDKYKKEITIVRDNFGQKPLFYGFVNNFFLITSELKTFKKIDNFNNSIDEKSLKLYFKYNYIPEPFTIWKNIKKLSPSRFAKIKIGDLKKYQFPKLYKYNFISENKTTLKNNYHEIINQSHDQIKTAIKRTMLSDVPIGTFLSGGIDSSIVTYFTQNQSIKKINSYTVRFQNKDYDESINATKIAKFIGTNHENIDVDNRNIVDFIFKLPNIYDEPFADSSQLPTLLVSEFASKKNKVVLTGDGADEIFGGYNRHQLSKKIEFIFNTLPLIIRSIISYFLNYSPLLLANFFEKILPNKHKPRLLSEKIIKFSFVLSSTDKKNAYIKLVSLWNFEKDNIFKKRINYNLDIHDQIFNEDISYLKKIIKSDLITYLPGDILTKLDRASMNFSLEARSPYLDPNLYNFIKNLDDKYFVSKKGSKWLLRSLAYKIFPDNLINRPKMGFGFPIKKIIINDLKETTSKIFNQQFIKSQGIFNENKLLKIWNNFKNNKNNHNHHEIWNYIVFQIWNEYNN